MTRLPSFVRWYATDSPAMPPPTMQTSVPSSSASLGPVGVSAVAIHTERVRPLSVSMLDLYRRARLRANGKSEEVEPQRHREHRGINKSLDLLCDFLPCSL